MIYIDHPEEYQVKGLMRGHKFKSSHMISDKASFEGTKELIDFASKIGMRVEWIQKKNTYAEHFDVMNSKFQTALNCGAKLISSVQLVAMMRNKVKIP